VRASIESRRSRVTINVNVNGDAVVEPNEYIIVSFRNPTYAPPSAASAASAASGSATSRTTTDTQRRVLET
jgi:hypothetical protein